jgi:uncharacterized repeat protein (TIGR01451 family)
MTAFRILKARGPSSTSLPPLRRPVTVIAIAAIAVVGAGVALGFWTGVGQVQGTGAGAATTVNAGPTPTVNAAGASGVLVSWNASTLANTGAVGGYLVKRYDAGTNVSQTVLTGCAGTITATSCTETSIPVGDWKYTVTPTVGDNWRGTEGAKSAAIATSSIDFLQAVTSPETVRPGPAGSAVGDVDNDGDPDVVTSNFYDYFASVLLNNGVGDFTEKLVVSNGSTVDAGLGNFDADANLDLVLLYQGAIPTDGLLVIFKGGGDGSFTYSGAVNQLVYTGVRSMGLAVGNFNGDAIADVAVVNAQETPSTTAGTVMTWLGNPAATDTFASASPAQTLTAQHGATDVEFADFNGGVADLAVSNELSGSISFFAGNGTGFNAPVNNAAGAAVYFLDSAQLNAGTNRDLVATVSNSNPSTVRTLMGDGAGGFPSQATTTAGPSGTGAFPQGVVAKDLDNDGDQDLGVANGDPASVSVLDNHGNGTFSPVATSPETGIGAPGTYPYEILAADFDGSGYNDLLVNNLITFPGETRTLLNQSGTKANLSISQSDSPDPVNAGSTLTYTLTATNAGPGTPTVVKASDTLPAGVTFNAAASSGTCSASGTTTVTVTCNYGSVVSGTPEAQQVAVTVGVGAASSITNTATIAGNLADPTPANNTSASTTTVTPDTQAPTHALSLNSPIGAFLSGSTLYYKSNAVGSFKLVDALADSGSGPASVTYPAIATTGWTHLAETVTTPAGGPYTSTTHSWTASPTNPTGYSVSGKDAANNTSASALTFVSDITAPATGSVGYTNGTYYTASVPVTTANGTDGGSGIDTSSGIVKRAQGTLNTSTQICGAIGGFTTTVTLVGGADTSVVSGNCYQYQYLVSDRVGNQATYSSANVAKVDTSTYTGSVLANSSLVNYYRLGETSTGSATSSDTMAGSPGATLQSRAGETGATWTKHIGVDSVLTDAGRLRKNTSSDKSAYYASGVPSSANYTVEADIHVKSIIANDTIGVVGRQDTANALGTFYFARYDTANTSWNLGKYVNGVITPLGSLTGQALTAGQTYHLELMMNGSALTLYVNDAFKVSATDSSITATGRAGVRLGKDGSAVDVTNSTGLHLDNFRVEPAATVAVDSKAANNGTYFNAPNLGVLGAISADNNTAVRFDGVDDYVSVARQIQDDFTIEFWFKSTQGTGTDAQWWGNAALVDAEVGGEFNDFGTSLRSDGRVVAGTGSPNVSIVSTSAGYNDGAWHHVAFTRNRLGGALALYIDGSPAGTATGASTQSLTSPPAITFGRQAAGAWNYVAGTLDEVAFYNTVLSQATISDHYARR